MVMTEATCQLGSKPCNIDAFEISKTEGLEPNCNRESQETTQSA